KLLPLARQELILKIHQEMVENPLLEDALAEEEGYDVTPEWQEDNSDMASASATADTGEPEVDLTAYFDNNLDLGYHEEDYSDSPSWENRLRKETTLSDHLLWQLSLTHVPMDLKTLAIEVIGNLNDNGYFRADIEDFAREAGCKAQDVERALEVVQGFDPPGIAARNLKECLCLQVRSLGVRDRLLDELLENHLDQLEDRFLPKLARSLGAELCDVVEAAQLIRTLNPRPGLRYNESRAQYVYPDLYVLKTVDEADEDYQVFLNEDGMPRLRINSTYRALLRNNKDNGARQYLEDRLRSAVWLIKSIEQRRQTLLKVARSIVRFQREFLDHGVPALRPLVLRDVALDIEMHESTVSRVTTGKYMHTPQGIFELKFFFHSELKSRFGESASSVSVKDQIRRMIGEEDPQRPLTDQRIVERLRGRNVVIARRTVTKYRKELKIPPASRRRRVTL
ncbi:MAG: RNA polymerase factor sigma-54, partial [Nitrospinota bacterium]